MTNHHDPNIGRRTVLKGTGVSLAALAGLASPVAAGKGKRKSLLDGPAEFRLYWSDEDKTADDPDKPGDFDYPSTPFLLSEDPNDMDPEKDGLFDASEIEMTPNGKALHHTLRFFNGFLIERNQGKPYILKNRGLDQETGLYRFAAHNQEMTFRAVSQEELADTQIGNGAYVPPFSTLAGGKWRALGREVIFILPGEDGSPGRLAPYSATRVDFYGLGGGSPEFELSLLYIIYPNEKKDSVEPIPTVPFRTGGKFITDGRRNLGGQ